jgi:ATP-dependent Clp protease adapter protein ClpS
MLEAHIKGKAIAKTGSFEEMVGMKKQLNVRGIEATVESNN